MGNTKWCHGYTVNGGPAPLRKQENSNHARLAPTTLAKIAESIVLKAGKEDGYPDIQVKVSTIQTFCTATWQ